jgi:restriction endonuclease
MVIYAKQISLFLQVNIKNLSAISVSIFLYVFKSSMITECIKKYFKTRGAFFERKRIKNKAG